jgi:hypothetical protein
MILANLPGFIFCVIDIKFSNSKEFHNLVERLLNQKIIAMQTDWGGEYECLNSFFHSIGISHLVSCPHVQQQNGAAERKHHSILDMGLALLANASMPLEYWDQAFLATAHLINHTPSKVLGYDTPLHRLLGAQHAYSNLRVFGCACVGSIYVHTIITNFSFDLLGVSFWVIVIIIKVTNVFMCLMKIFFHLLPCFP